MIGRMGNNKINVAFMLKNDWQIGTIYIIFFVIKELVKEELVKELVKN